MTVNKQKGPICFSKLHAKFLDCQSYLALCQFLANLFEDTMSVLRAVLLCQLTMLSGFKCIYAENIVRHACNTQATFYKIASNYSMNDANKITNTTSDGYMGCVDLCVECPLCKAFNYKAVKTNEAICELLHKDRTTNPNGIVSKAGWNYYDTGLLASQVNECIISTRA